MKKIAIFALAACAMGSVFAQTSVGLSIGINQPGVYGRINIGSYPQPVLFNPQPIIVAPQPVAVVRAPIYLYVPEEHRLHWARYCGRYAACGQPVHFVQERWVRDTWEREHAHERDRRHGWDEREHRDEHRHDERGHDDRRHD